MYLLLFKLVCNFFFFCAQTTNDLDSSLPENLDWDAMVKEFDGMYCKLCQSSIEEGFNRKKYSGN